MLNKTLECLINIRFNKTSESYNMSTQIGRALFSPLLYRFSQLKKAAISNFTVCSVVLRKKSVMTKHNQIKYEKSPCQTIEMHKY